MTKNEFIEEVFELAFGYDAINSGYTRERVLEQLKHIEDYWSTFGPSEPIEELDKYISDLENTRRNGEPVEELDKIIEDK